MTGRARSVTIVALAAIATVAAAFWIAARTAVDDGPEGTAALERLLDVTGSDVRTADRPDEGTFVVLVDQRAPDEVEEVLDWVAAGGRLVLADPFSQIAGELTDEPTGLIGGRFGGVGSAEPGCAVPETAGVERIAVRATEPALRTTVGRMIGCFPGQGGPLLAVVPHGDGRILLLGGPSPLSNELLREEDNALFALRLLAPDHGPVTFGTPRPVDAAGPALREAVPSGAEAAAVGLLVAFLVFAAARARRLGLSPQEEPVAPIPADALVTATGSLYRNAGDRAHAAQLLRRDAVRRIRRRLGHRADDDPDDAVAHARALGIDDAETLLAGSAPRDDEELIRLAAGVEAATRELEEMDR